MYVRKDRMCSDLNTRMNAKFRSLGLYSIDSKKFELFVIEKCHGGTMLQED